MSAGTGPAGRSKKEALVTGLRHEASYVVSPEMCPAHLPTQVLSTPSMVALIEGCCLELVQPHIGAQETTVGTHVCVSHSGPAMVGETVVVASELTRIEGKRLSFAVTVRAPRGPISEGTHQRAVLDPSRFG